MKIHDKVDLIIQVIRDRTSLLDSLISYDYEKLLQVLQTCQDIAPTDHLRKDITDLLSRLKMYYDWSR